MFAPMLVIASRTFEAAPSPIAIVQMTALTPTTTPSMVSALRILLRASAFTATRGIISGVMIVDSGLDATSIALGCPREQSGAPQGIGRLLVSRTKLRIWYSDKLQAAPHS